jgi:HD-GYP domain-containing protein (c-di-GMP phosphodiesterase class II)
VAVCDAFDAMTSERAYRPPMRVEDAIEVLYQGAGWQWDASLVALFVGLVRGMVAPEPVRAR